MTVSDFRLANIRTEIQKTIEERNMIENKLKEEAREPGWDFPCSCKAYYLIYVMFFFCLMHLFLLQEGNKLLQNLNLCFLHFLRKWDLCKVN